MTVSAATLTMMIEAGLSRETDAQFRLYLGQRGAL